MSISEWLTVGIATVALILSAFATFNTIKSNSRQNEVNESQAEINRRLLEEDDEDRALASKACLDAKFVKIGKRHKLRIYNRGKCVARNVSLSMPEDNSPFSSNELKQKFPYKELEPHACVEVLALVHWGTPRRHSLKLTWDDDYANKRTVVRERDID